jgi:hypothetical protein
MMTFKLQTLDLSPTFGSPLGAQFVDVYVHNRSAALADTSTLASFPQRNYVIAPSDAWSQPLLAKSLFPPRLLLHLHPALLAHAA